VQGARGDLLRLPDLDRSNRETATLSAEAVCWGRLSESPGDGREQAIG
jgi:hypothetical protein